jgi:DmsE family decaheme c-type cytochrome
VQHLVKLVFALLGLVVLSGAALAAPVDDPIPADVCVECHQPQYEAIGSGAHWRKGDPRTPAARQACATCHGDLEEHAMSEGQDVPDGMRVFGRESRVSSEEQDALCMSCHKESHLLHWQGSVHDAEDVGCVGCHRIHGEDKVRSRESEQEVCFSCHADMRGDVYKPYTHPLREHKMSCGDCHGPHGGPGDAGLKTFSVNEACYSCHAEKRGPYLWEHAPVSENCVLCHSAHGSIHPGMLDRRQPHLCQSCHEPTGPPNTPGGPHARHARLALSFREPGEPDIGPNPLGERGISRFVMGEACSNCHSQVHGSNHPAGAKLTR